MKNIFIRAFLPLMVLLTGCVQPKAIEELGIINTRGVDILEDDIIETTLVFLKFDSQNQNISKVISGTGHTIKDARSNANLKTNFNLTPGQIRMELYGQETAKKGLLTYLDTLIRDARVSDTMFLAVSDTTASDVITSVKNESPVGIGKYLHDLIETNIKDNVIPRITLQDFMHMYYDKGQDPILPVLSSTEKSPALTHLAIFQDDKMVGRIPVEDALYITMFTKSIEEVNFEISLPRKPFEKYSREWNIDEQNEDNFYTLMRVLDGDSKTTITDVQNLQFQTEINMDVILLELTEEINIKNPTVIKLFEKELEKKIKRQYESLLAKLQEMNADPFGYGTIYRIHKPNGKLKKNEWRDKFSTIEVDYKINVRILRHGTVP